MKSGIIWGALTIATSVPLLVQAQLTPSTYAEIYDFDIGDTLVFHIGDDPYGYSSYEQDILKIYISEQLLSNGDSVLYMVNKVYPYLDPYIWHGVFP